MSAFTSLLREGWRSLRNNLGTTLIATVLLAAGFAISLVVISLARSAFESLGSPIPATLMLIGEADGAGNVGWTHGPDVLKLRTAAPEAMAQAAVVRPLRVSLRGPDRNLSLEGALIDGPLFANLHWPLALGREFEAEDADRGAVILGHELWRSRFDADPTVIGRQLQVDGRAVTVVGVLPPYRSYPFHQQIYLAHRLDARSPMFERYWEVCVHADSPGQLDALRQAASAVQVERLQLLGDAAREEPLQVRTSMGNGVPADSQAMIGMLMLMGALLLILGSTNAGGLLLVHWLARSRELATRAALGSTRARLFGICLTQALLLVGLALALAYAVAAVLLKLLQDYLHSGSNGIPAYMQLSVQPHATWPVLVAALGCVLVVAAPVLWRLRSPDLNTQIRAGERGNSHAGWLGSALFGLQCLLSVATVLLTLICGQGARLMMQVDTGLDTTQVLTARFANADTTEQARLGRKLLADLQRDPALSAVSLSNSMPLLVQRQLRLNVGERAWTIGVSPVDAAYQQVYGITPERGHWFSQAQVDNAEQVAVLDRSAAELLFAGEDPIGRSFEERQADGSVLRYVVQAVIPPVRTVDDPGPDKPSVFIPMRWNNPGGLVLAVRTRNTDPNSYIATLEQRVRSADPALALEGLRSFAGVHDEAGAMPRFILTLFAPLGALALLLAATGLTALLGSLVARRMRELGIRRALGASGTQLVGPLLRQLGVFGVSGMLLGLLLSWPLANALSDGVFGGEVLGAGIYLATLLTMALALLLAAAAPVRRALRVDPVLVLRQE